MRKLDLKPATIGLHESMDLKPNLYNMAQIPSLFYKAQETIRPSSVPPPRWLQRVHAGLGRAMPASLLRGRSPQPTSCGSLCG